MKTLYLIDGHAQFFRAFHAIRTPMSSPITGEPTNATFGFIGMLLKLMREKKPDAILVAIDVSGDTETFRSRIYPEYKAHREAPPDTLIPQIGRCISVLQAIGIPVLGIEGYEADDVIATVVDRARGRGMLVRIVSKDKDLQQLIRTGEVEMYDPYTDELIDEPSLCSQKGITPSQVRDMLALMGDTVDNVPGVPGIGLKTACQLIAQYGDLDAIIADADNIKGKRGENIRASLELLPVSRQLVTLIHDVPIDIDLSAGDVAEHLHFENLIPILRELGFRRYQDDVKEMLGLTSADTDSTGFMERAVIARQSPAAASPATSADGQGSLFGGGDAATATPRLIDGEYRAVRSPKELRDVIAQIRAAPIVAVDTETTGLSPLTTHICGISVAIREGAGWYIPIRSPDPGTHMTESEVIGELRPVLEDPSVKKCGHNLKFDMLVLRRAGIRLRGMVSDSMVASYLLDASRSSHSLDNLALAFLNHVCIPISDLIGARGKAQKTFDQVPLDQAVPYAAEDADVSLRLHNIMQPQLRAMNLMKLYDHLEMPLVEVLAELEWNGITVDAAELDRQAGRLATRIDALRADIAHHSPYPFNPDSPKQLAAALFNSPDHAEFPGLGIKPLKKTKTGQSTDAEVLEKLAADDSITSPIPKLIVEYRMLTKLVSTYLVALREAINSNTGRIHASFHQTVAATGRLASSDPNLQNIPIRTDVGREIRRAFIAPPGRVLISADYSQVELRLLAHLARDAALIEAFRGGADIHKAVAAEIHGVPLEQVTRDQRSGAKMVNFGIVYGITAFGLARRLGVPQGQAAEIIAGYKARFPGITVFLEECIAQARQKGYVETIMQRRRPIPNADARNPSLRSLAERTAINSVVQGSAADLIKKAMVEVHAALNGDGASSLPATIRGRRGEVQMLLQIHDELVFEAPEEMAGDVLAYVTDAMSRAMVLDVPLVVDGSYGKTWFEGK